MVLLLAAVLTVLGVVAWSVVVYATIRVLVLVPTGRRLRALRFLGRWQFPEVAGLGGDATIRHCNLFLRAMMFFLGVVACAVVLAGVVFIDSQNGPPADVSMLDPATVTSSA